MSSLNHDFDFQIFVQRVNNARIRIRDTKSTTYPAIQPTINPTSINHPLPPPRILTTWRFVVKLHEIAAVKFWINEHESVGAVCDFVSECVSVSEKQSARAKRVSGASYRTSGRANFMQLLPIALRCYCLAAFADIRKHIGIISRPDLASQS